MRNIAKSAEPPSLRKHRQTPGADWDGYNKKQEAFAALCGEQGNLCAYCMSRIKPDQRPYNVEHWIAQKHSPTSPYQPSVHAEQQLQWSNLLGVCTGGVIHGVPTPRSSQHCDRYRGNKPLFIHPACEPRPLEDLFTYAKDGRISSDDPGASQDIRTLNLNVGRLVANRASVFDELMKALPRSPKTWTVTMLRKELDKWQKRTAKGYREYNQVAIAFIEKQLRKR